MRRTYSQYTEEALTLLAGLIRAARLERKMTAQEISERAGISRSRLQRIEFDRQHTNHGWTRKAMISALTLFGLDDMMARYASYETLAEIIRHRFANPKDTLRELFSRLIFNILCGNTDDHARNHAAFWDGTQLQLTPAYDICLQGRAGNEASQAMLISGRNNLSQIKTCLATAHNFLLSKDQASEIFKHQKSIIEQHWKPVCDEAGLNEVDKKLFWGRQFLNPFSLEID